MGDWPRASKPHDKSTKKYILNFEEKIVLKSSPKPFLLRFFHFSSTDSQGLAVDFAAAILVEKREGCCDVFFVLLAEGFVALDRGLLALTECFTHG